VHGHVRSSAAAKPPHLLPFKLCKSVISAGDFDDGLSQMLGSHTFSVPGETDDSSTCQFASTAADSAGVVREFVGAKVEAQLRHLGPNPRNYRDKGPWPAGASRTVLHIFGAYADAEIGYGLGTYDLAYGYLDVKNATITIEEKDSPPRLPASMLTLLKDARHTL